jgi:hypothetical protein
MKAIIHSLGQVLYSPSQYVIPVFQRHYRWELPQWQRLWESLEDIQQPGKTGNHFMGFLVYVVGSTPQPGQPTRFYLIDGQQRLTTLSLLLASIRNVARRSQQEDLAQEIHEDYLVHPRRRGEHRYRLLPKEHDQAAYLAIVNEKQHLPGRMTQALAFFERMLQARIAVQTEALRQLFEVVCQRLDFMGATLESENAYSIFKSLNSTGVPLSQADLIRNFVFMHVPPDEQEEFDDQFWSSLEARFSNADGKLDEERFARFFRDLLMAEGQYVKPKLTFDTFEARHEATGFEPVTLARQLGARAEHYVVIGSHVPDRSQVVTRALARLNQLDSSTTWPLLLWLFAQRDAGRLDDAGLAKAVAMLSGFILRRFVAGDSSRGYGEMFVRAIRDASADGAGEPPASLEQYLLQRGWPDDARFIEAFVRFPLYKRGNARAVLEALERARGHREQGSLDQVQIEHVLPQTLSDAWAEALGDDAESVHAEWLHRPGNLTLSAYNQEVGNQPFAVKRARFAQSNVGLTRELADYPHWTEAEIQARGEMLGREAIALWIGPKEAYAADDEPALEQEARQARLAFWTGFAAHLDSHYPELPGVAPAPKRAVRVRSGVRCVRLVLRYKVQDGSVALVLKFRGEAVALWEKLRDAPELANGWVGQSWSFDDGEGNEAGMFLDFAPNSKDSGWWPDLYDWLATKLSLVHAHALPWLREGLGQEDEDDDGAQASPTKLLQQQFWGVLAEEMAGRRTVLRPQKPLPQHWTNYAIGRAGFTLMAYVNSREERVGSDLIIATDEAKSQFQALFAQRESIEAALGFELDWHELPHRMQSKIGCCRGNSPFADRAHWPEYTAWIADRLVRMDEVFRPVVRALP